VRRWPGSLTNPAALVTAGTLSLVLSLAGCSGDDGDERGEPEADPSTSATAKERVAIPSRVEVGEVAGRLGKRPARRVAADVAEVVDRWLDAAYVAGDYPRSKFGDAFPGFTKDAAALAARQRGLMSNQAVGDDVDSVTATRRVVRVDLLAPGGKAAGATAHVNLVIKMTGRVDRTDQVRGSVVLTRSGSGWRMFGFDVERGEVKG
jgi:hypothetical protein